MPNHTANGNTLSLSASFRSTKPHRTRGPARHRVRERLKKAVGGYNARNPLSFRNTRLGILAL